MKSHFSFEEKMRLANATADALYDAFANLKLSEPQLIANLVSEFPKHLNAIRLSGTTKIKAGGVFVHARPFVTCSSFPKPSPKSVEIGDLLLIRTLVVSGKVEERRALLLQAKKADRIPVTPDNQNQWHLYERWPRFTYASRSGSLTGKSRCIKAPDMYDAAKYLLIGSEHTLLNGPYMYWRDWPLYLIAHWPEVFIHYTAQPTKPEISRYKTFADELVEFLVGNAGKVFDTPKPRTRGWNQVIYDLLNETAKAKTIFMERAVGSKAKSTRGSGVFFCKFANQADYLLVADTEDSEGDNFNIPPEVPIEWSEDGDGGGISILEFIVEQAEG
ncbi:hypothetical protein [Methylophilus sp. 5]|uniref:hypothetical protein n=1 Tax=Methylophilus sp. 5 TaxID=1112274 RepID=UPI00048A52DC|nr:hypothetical protein [Methylophilus sp. 5]